MKRNKILVIGGTEMELTMNMYRIPEPSQTMTDDGGVAYIPGGKGASSAVSLTRLGADAVLLSKLGRDLHGQQLYAYLRENGVDTSQIKVDTEAPTAMSVRLRAEDGERKIIYNGAMEKFTRENIRDAFSVSFDALAISLDLPVELVIYAIGCAEARGIPVFLDASPAEADYPLESLPSVEVFSPNEKETEIFTGIEPIGLDASLRAAISLFRRVKCRYLVIKQGERGSFVYDGKHYFMIPPINAGKAQDTSGAGDAFNAGLTVRYLLRSADIKSAVQYGSVVAAITVTRKGGYASVPKENEVIEFLEKYTN